MTPKRAWRRSCTSAARTGRASKDSRGMPLHAFDQLFQDADALAQLLPVAVAGGADRSVLEALRTACDRGWIRPVVTGEEREVRRIAAECAVSLQGFTILDADDAAASA